MLDETLRQAWQNGTLLCGISAGAICWFEHGISDSVAESELRPLTCMGLLSGTACPHYNESGRREAYHRYLKSGDVTDGFGIENGVGLHFVGSKLVRTVASSADVHGYRVSMRHGVATEAALTPTLLQ
jgi:dipeptidase E